MHAINMNGMEIACQGEAWPHAVSPCSKHAIPLLEQNERVVSWVSPIGGGVADHIPAIQFKGKFYTLSLRMQKAIYRHIRLKKGFSNEEIIDGVPKLRIPAVLLKEKIRTQFRFDAMRRKASSSGKCEGGSGEAPPAPKKQRVHEGDGGGAGKKATTGAAAAAAAPIAVAPVVRAAAPPPPAASASCSSGRDRSKSSCTVSARLKQVVDQMLAYDETQYAAAVEQLTVFVFKSQQSELILNFLEDIRRENPTLFRDRPALLRMIADRYDSLARGACA